LHYEAKLAAAAEQGSNALAAVVQRDLKGLLLQTLHELDERGASKSDSGRPASVNTAYRGTEAVAARNPQPSLTAPLTQHLNNIEAQQAVNVLAQTRGEAFQLQVPFPTPQGMTTAYLAVERDGRGESEQPDQEANHNVLLMFDLDTLGPTRIDARLDATNLSAVFYVQRDDALTLLRAELPTFKDRLHALGYRQVLLDARPLHQLDPERRQKFDALSASVPANRSLIDVKA